MRNDKSVRRFVLAIGAVALLAGVAPAVAQDITPEHLKAARSVMDALNATAEFDIILPSAATALKAELIQKDPNLQELIVSLVDENALKLASRRGDLEREAATAYARAFTEDELKSIAKFYTSEAGKKLIVQGPLVTREVIQAADIWQRGVARDLSVAVGEALAAAVAASRPAPKAAPAAKPAQ